MLGWFISCPKFQVDWAVKSFLCGDATRFDFFLVCGAPKLGWVCSTRRRRLGRHLLQPKLTGATRGVGFVGGVGSVVGCFGSSPEVVVRICIDFTRVNFFWQLPFASQWIVNVAWGDNRFWSCVVVLDSNSVVATAQKHFTETDAASGLSKFFTWCGCDDLAWVSLSKCVTQSTG